MKDAAAAYLPGPGVAGIICLAVAFVGIIISLMGFLRPRTNTACVAALLIFFVAWMIECSAHMLVTYAHLPVEWRQRGVLFAAVLFAAGLVTAVIGLIGVTRNEHRYKHGFVSGLLAVGGNGWVVAAAVTAIVNGEIQRLGRGMVFPIVTSDKALDQEDFRRRMGAIDPAGESDLQAYQDLMTELVARMLSQGATDEANQWREIPLGDAQFVKTIDPEAKRLFSSPTGPGWMSLFVQKQDGITPDALEQQAANGLKRALDAGSATEIGWRERRVVEGFEVCRAGYVATLPTLPGAHVFDRWLAGGHGWRLSIVQWTPASATATDFRRRSDSLARMLLSSVVLRSAPASRRSEEVEALLAKAGSAAQKKDLAAAVSSYRQAAAKAPGDTEIALLVTATLEQFQQQAAALEFLDKRQPQLTPSPVIEAARLRLLAATTPADPAVDAGFERLLNGGFRDDPTLAACLGLHDARRAPAAGAAAVDRWGADHCRAVVAAWHEHFARAAAAASTAASAAAIPASAPPTAAPETPPPAPVPAARTDRPARPPR